MEAYLNALDVKSILADHLLGMSSRDVMLASEVPFFYGYRRADMLAFLDRKIHSFEIKSDFDSLKKLEDQINDYRKTFSYNWVVVTAKHLNTAKNIIPQSTGLIVINGTRGCEVVRDARENKRLSKNNLSLLISPKDLTKALKNKGIACEKIIKNNHCIRELSEKVFSVDELANMAYIRMYEKYKRAFDLFRFDRGTKTTQEDIYYLSGVK